MIYVQPILEWNYDGYKKIKNLDEDSQNDWNQTLITMFNQANACYHKTLADRDSNIIKVSNNIMTDIIKTLLYYDETTSMLGHRKIVIDDSLTDALIVIGNTDYPEIILALDIKNYRPITKKNKTETND